MKLILLLITGALALAAQTRTPPSGAQLTAQLESLLSKIATYNYGGDPSPAIQLDELIGRASGSAESRKVLEARLLRFLQSDATPAGKEAAFRGLSIVGSDASIAVLSPMLIAIDTAEMARYALAAIPGPAVDDALRKALSQGPSDRIRIGLINSLGRRRDAKAVPVLSPLLTGSNLELTAAAAAALAAIADRPALDALRAARSKAQGPARDVVTEAFVVSAGHFAGRGENAVASGVFREVITSEPMGSIRVRALAGFAKSAGNGALQFLRAELGFDDKERQVHAIRLLAEMPGPEVTKTLAAVFPKLTAVGQVHVLTAIASRGESAARTLITAAISSPEPAVRAAALDALGKAGDESSVKILADAAAGTPGAEQAAARRSLYALRGAGVDAAITKAIDSASGRARTELIIAAGERAAVASADTLVRAAQSGDADVRRESLRSLRNVAGASQAPPLLDLTIKASTATERREAAQTLAFALKRSPAAAIQPVIAAYNNTSAKAARLTLLDVLGQTSRDEALPLLRTAIRDADPEIARGGILALTNWDTSGPLPDLLALAKGAARTAPPEAGAPAAGPGGGRGGPPPTNNLQILALRGVLRLILLPSQRSAAENGALLGDAMRLAAQVPEKRTVLSLLPSFPSKESLKVAQEAVNDRDVANEAKIALDQVNEALKL
jgi:HEAT repeat protein